MVSLGRAFDGSRAVGGAKIKLRALLAAVALVCAAACGREPPPEPEKAAPPRPLFTDVAAESGISFRHMPKVRSSLLTEDTGSGACFADFDGDGDLDAFLANFGGRNAFYVNEGGGRFSEATAEAGLEGRGDAMGCLSGDIDNDGDQDLLVTAVGPDTLYRNDGTGRFEDWTRQSGLKDGGWGMGAVFGDYDLDGDLDLYIPHYVAYGVKAASKTLQMDRDGNLDSLVRTPLHGAFAA